jgi:hypothetical protein
MDRGFDSELNENHFVDGTEWRGGFEMANISTIGEIFIRRLWRRSYKTEIQVRDAGKSQTGALQNPGTDLSRLRIAAEVVKAFLPETNRPLKVQSFEVINPSLTLRDFGNYEACLLF